MPIILWLVAHALVEALPDTFWVLVAVWALPGAGIVTAAGAVAGAVTTFITVAVYEAFLGGVLACLGCATVGGAIGGVVYGAVTGLALVLLQRRQSGEQIRHLFLEQPDKPHSLVCPKKAVPG